MKFLRYVTFLLILPAIASAGSITVPVKFHLMHDVVIQHGNQAMDVWLTEPEIRGKIIEEVNRIWSAAHIQWVVSDVVTEDSRKIPDKVKQLAFISNSARDISGKADKRVGTILYNLIDKNNVSHSAVNIYIVPFMGNGSQGKTLRSKNVIFIGLWSNKSSHGINTPTKVKLTEPEPFQDGSLSRTVAHELGHILSLQHPNKSTQIEFNRLMGGKKPGYKLTPNEIEKARIKAATLFH